jgi:RNA polymerase sigma-70 factor (ECF subfamily)
MSSAVASELTSATPRPGDDDLMPRARHGDRVAYGQIVIQYKDRLFNVLFHMVGDAEEAAELTQEVITRGLHRMTEAEPGQSAYAWLFRMGLNLCVVALRKSRRRRAFGPGLVLEALGRVDPDYRVVLVLRDIDGLDYPQMAEVLDMPAAAVQSRLFRARLALWDELRDKVES